MGWRSSTPGLAVVIAVALGACSNKPPENKDYAARLAAGRAAKDAEFLKEDDPVPKSRKAELLPLAYFPIDPDYNVPAALKPAETETVVDMPTSTGTPRRQRI